MLLTGGLKSLHYFIYLTFWYFSNIRNADRIEFLEKELNNIRSEHEAQQLSSQQVKDECVSRLVQEHEATLNIALEKNSRLAKEFADLQVYVIRNLSYMHY